MSGVPGITLIRLKRVKNGPSAGDPLQVAPESCETKCPVWPDAYITPGWSGESATEPSGTGASSPCWDGDQPAPSSVLPRIPTGPVPVNGKKICGAASTWSVCEVSKASGCSPNVSACTAPTAVQVAPAFVLRIRCVDPLRAQSTSSCQRSTASSWK